MMSSNYRLLTTADAARMLQISQSALNKWRLCGGGPHYVKIGRCVRYSEGEIAAYIERQVRVSTSGGS